MRMLLNSKRIYNNQHSKWEIRNIHRVNRS